MATGMCVVRERRVERIGHNIPFASRERRGHLSVDHRFEVRHHGGVGLPGDLAHLRGVEVFQLL